MKVGRPEDERRARYMKTYGLRYAYPCRRLTTEFMDMLDRCPTEEARKLLLGIREPLTDGMREAG